MRSIAPVPLLGCWAVKRVREDALTLYSDSMANENILRRASYGPKSPVVGKRGARTRQQIVDVALDLFATHGFHGTSVDGIARNAGISRATLYQYFESKDQIFIELLDECGSALMRVVRRLGPLGPTPEGFDNLHWWLGEWAWVYDKYATMFAQWTQVDSPQTAVRPLVAGFVDAYAERIARRLQSSGVEGLDLRHAAVALVFVVNRFNDFRHMGLRSDQSDQEMLDSLAVIIQLMLFPDTPARVFTGHELRTSEATLPALSEVTADTPAPDRFEHLSPRARRTVRQLMEAACHAFAEHGYYGAKIDDVIKEAGVARGTFYKYFDDKLDLLRAVAEEARTGLTATILRFAEIQPGPQCPEQLRTWLREYMPVRDRYLAVIRVWSDGQVDDPAVQSIRRQSRKVVRAAFGSVVKGVEHPYPFNLDVAALVFNAVMDRVPAALTDRTPALSEDEVIETVAAFIERGLLNGRPLGLFRGDQPDSAVAAGPA